MPNSGTTSTPSFGAGAKIKTKLKIFNIMTTYKIKNGMGDIVGSIKIENKNDEYLIMYRYGKGDYEPMCDNIFKNAEDAKTSAEEQLSYFGMSLV